MPGTTVRPARCGSGFHCMCGQRRLEQEEQRPTMDDQRISAALRAASDTRRVVIGAGTMAAVDATFAACFGQEAAVVVADENTFAVAGKTVLERLRAGGYAVEEPIIFPGEPTLYADFENVLQLERQLQQRAA